MRLKSLLLMSAICTTSIVANAQSKNNGLLGDKIIPSKNQGHYGMAGCGLGSVLFGESEHRGGQILAGTTNDIYSNNTFGMSSGTSECVQGTEENVAEVKRNLEKFIVANQGAFENDVARRQGDTIVAVNQILGCKNKDYLAATLQANYQTIFQSNQSAVVTESMVNVVKSDSLLNETCNI